MAAKAAKTDGGDGAKKGKGKLLLLALVGLLVVGGGGGAAAYFLGFLGGGKAAEAKAGGEHAAESHDEAAAEPGAGGHGGEEPAGEQAVRFVDLPDVIVNLRSDERRTRFLKLRIVIEVESGKAADSVTLLTPRIMDSFQMYLRALTVEDVQGSAGMERLKEEMMARANLAIEPTRIGDLLFKEMLVQ